VDYSQKNSSYETAKAEYEDLESKIEIYGAQSESLQANLDDMQDALNKLMSVESRPEKHMKRSRMPRRCP